MAQTFNKLAGDSASGDKLTASGIQLPPLQLSPKSIELLKAIWR